MATAIVAELGHAGDQDAVVGHGRPHGVQQGFLGLHGDLGLVAAGFGGIDLGFAAGPGRHFLGKGGKDTLQGLAGVAIYTVGIRVIPAQLLGVDVYLDDFLSFQ